MAQWVPDVSNARARVDAQLRAHGGTYAPIAADSRIAVAIVAVEDERFYQHGGVDPLGLLRALLVDISHLSKDSDERNGLQGGSTITQQLAKALYAPTPQDAPGLSDEQRLRIKLRGMAVAVELERHFPKNTILEWYLNSIYFGAGHWGISQASRGYFGKAPEALDWAEASLLAGLPQAPSAYNPTQYPEAARQRQAEVLGVLVRTGALTPKEATDAAARPLNVRR